VFKLGIWNDLVISYKWYVFGLNFRSKVRVRVNSNMVWVITLREPSSFHSASALVLYTSINGLPHHQLRAHFSPPPIFCEWTYVDYRLQVSEVYAKHKVLLKTALNN